MTRAETERWLADLQARFSAVLRAPLSASGGTLHSDVRSYPPEAIRDVAPGQRLSAEERLAVYQRQYWMRLLKTLQEQYPLTVHLCGAWQFNQHAIAFLLRHPPRGHDLGDIAEAFAGFLETSVHGDPLPRAGATPLPLAVLREAARLDAAFRRVFCAPEQPPFRPTPGAEAELVTRRLRISRALARVDEHDALLELRARVCAQPDGAQPDGAPLALPPAWPHRRTWAIYRTPGGVAHAPLDPEQARLLDLLERHALGEALAILESECEPGRRDGLPDRTRHFLAQAVQHGFFSGFA